MGLVKVMNELFDVMGYWVEHRELIRKLCCDEAKDMFGSKVQQQLY